MLFARQNGKTPVEIRMAQRIEELEERVDELDAERGRMKDVIIALLTCADDGADGRECPMYSDDAPFRCMLEPALMSIGIYVSDSLRLKFHTRLEDYGHGDE